MYVKHESWRKRKRKKDAEIAAEIRNLIIQAPDKIELERRTNKNAGNNCRLSCIDAI